MVLYCTNCGERLDENATRCTKCGATIVQREVGGYIDCEISSNENKESRTTLNMFLALIGEIVVLTVVTVFLNKYNVNLFLIIGLWVISIAAVFFDNCKSKVIQKVIEFIGVFIVGLIIIAVYNGYQDNKYVEMVQEQEFMKVSYLTLFESFSYDLEWKCTERNRFTCIDTKDTSRSGGYEAVVTISGGCYVNNEETNYVLTYYISEGKNEVVPMSLECYGTTYSSRADIQRFINSVYRWYLEN